MQTFLQYLSETQGRGTKGDHEREYGDFNQWQSHAKQLGYHVTHRSDTIDPTRKWSVAHKIEKKDPKDWGKTSWGMSIGPPGQRVRGYWWHDVPKPHGFLRYKYMPTNEAVINTAQDKAQRQAFKGLEKKIIKPTIPKSTDLQKKLIKPMQSNIKNMIDAIASHPAGIPSGIPGGQIG